jgi:hypothetical protein
MGWVPPPVPPPLDDVEATREWVALMERRIGQMERARRGLQVVILLGAVLALVALACGGY